MNRLHTQGFLRFYYALVEGGKVYAGARNVDLRAQAVLLVRVAFPILSWNMGLRTFCNIAAMV